MVKVLNIPTNGVRREGINSMQLRWTRAMNKNDLQLDIAAVRDNAEDVIEDYKKLGCNVFVLPHRKKKILSYCFKLYKLLKKEKYDVIHVHGSSGFLGVELLIAKIAGVPVRIAHSRNTTCDNKFIDKLFRPILYACMTKGLACSKAAGEWLFGNRPFEVIHNGINTESFRLNEIKRSEVRKKLGIENSLTIGFVGNIKQQKNPLFLVDIISELAQKDLAAKLLIVGDGTMMKPMKDKITELSLNKDVIFIGRSNDVPQYMSAMDAFVFPSLYEGFGNVALEAQLSGLQVYVSETVPEDCKLSDHIAFLPINNGPKVWVDNILKNGKVENDVRLERYDEVCINMKKNHFDIYENAKRLRELYIDG